MSPLKALILCADDYGLHAGISEGIWALLAQQRLSATSCMSMAPQWPEAASALKQLPVNGFAVGLHFNLSQALGVQTHIPLHILLRQHYWGGVSRPWVRHSLHQQLDAFEQHWGKAPDFVDGHQHVHQLRGVREELVLALSERYGQLPAAQRPYVRSTLPPAQASLKARFIAHLGAQTLKVQLTAAGFVTNQGFAGVRQFHDRDPQFLSQLSTWMHALPDNGLLMCHPSRATGDPLAITDGIYSARLAEFRVLSSPAFTELLQRCGVQLVSRPV